MTNSPDRHARAVLPIPDRPAPGLTTYDAKDPDTSFPPIEPLLPPAGAPNVLIVLLDDVGLRCVERVRRTVPDTRPPNGSRRVVSVQPLPHHGAVRADRAGDAHRLATTTRSAWAASPRPRRRRPGNSSLRPNTKAPLAMTLKLNGYSTAQFGKCHEVPVWQSSPMGPFDAWPSGGGGFETFYGFIGGENNQWDPALYDGTTPVEPPATRRGGLPPHRGPGRPGGELDAPAEGADAGQAVLRVLRARARRMPRTTSPKEWADKYRGPVRRRVGRAARAHVRRARRSWASSPPTPSSRAATPRSRRGTTCPTS